MKDSSSTEDKNYRNYRTIPFSPPDISDLEIEEVVKTLKSPLDPEQKSLKKIWLIIVRHQRWYV